MAFFLLCIVNKNRLIIKIRKNAHVFKGEKYNNPQTNTPELQNYFTSHNYHYVNFIILKTLYSKGFKKRKLNIIIYFNI